MSIGLLLKKFFYNIPNEKDEQYNIGEFFKKLDFLFKNYQLR